MEFTSKAKAASTKVREAEEFLLDAKREFKKMLGREIQEDLIFGEESPKIFKDIFFADGIGDEVRFEYVHFSDDYMPDDCLYFVISGFGALRVDCTPTFSEVGFVFSDSYDEIDIESAEMFAKRAEEVTGETYDVSDAEEGIEYLLQIVMDIKRQFGDVWGE